ncbi:radical SAM family heme chaperone HemW [Synechococcus sp. PCC 6312]|uniref:radical SAM family heme chaperone HemW n=1 Tax=Synechococcus sp. (strain ATCC 27167 / PCC 6312) TaxID=195253 RepID=UPI00029F30AD|nr:radical SAM family heme chaperone HemW [Synechococcus sp. PCC 6312]AFY59935.1 coproporphyrinogen III oxidase, anaerobic [Synechococcus sp. PCC 6312]
MESKGQSLVRPRAAYIHIPFCRRRCFYCDFPISVIGEKAYGDTAQAIHQYVAALIREIELTPGLGLPLNTIFFGGGTPSLLSPGQVTQILTQLDKKMGIDPASEISLEVDPGTFTKSQIQGYRECGVTRLSLGVQAFQDDLLKACGRFHRVKDIQQAVGIIQEIGFENWSLDLISGLPGQTLRDWENSLTAVIKLQPTHVSAYDLVLEPTTVFGKKFHPGQTPLPDDDTTAEMYLLADQILTSAGYDHYEISNYARPGFRCQHNQVYWRNESYYGFGLGATSYVDHRRLSRPKTRATYYEWLANLPNNLTAIEPTSQLDRWLETLMLGLRLRDGVDLRQLEKEFPRAWVKQLINLTEIEPKLKIKTNRIHLTVPDGFLFSNQVLGKIWEIFDESEM